MEPFEDWLASCTQPSVQKWAKRLVELGASWHTFRGDLDDTIEDLTSSGIPLLAAKTVCKVAAEALRRSEVPLSIFWDIENVGIPSDVSGAKVATRLKSILEPYGQLKHFRGYASMGLCHIPEEKRSELQLSGCHLVDTPHAGRKEVADKMIIVDAMEFAYLNPDGATLCFITGDVDYAYLLAKLQQKPQWSTIVISKGTMMSMLHVNCDMKMRWETDVLQLRPVKSSPSPPPGFPTATIGSELFATAAAFNDTNSLASSLETLTFTEEWVDDVELLRSIVASGVLVGGPTPGTLKSRVGNTLRQTNPARFCDRSVVQAFLSRAIQEKIVTETGDGATKVLHLPSETNISLQPPITLSDKAPVNADDLGPNTLQYLLVMPFALFIKKQYILTGTKLSGKGAMIQNCGHYMILMFQTLTQAQRKVASNPVLRLAILVDWRTATQPKMTKLVGSIVAPTVRCASCDAICLKSNLFAEPDCAIRFCQDCFESRDFWTQSEASKAESKVVEMMQMMAENDDICVPRNVLKKELQRRWPLDAVSHGQADSWIEGAIETGVICEIKHKTKNKVIFLPENERWTKMPHPPDDIDTSSEGEEVLGWLWGSEGCCMDRKAVISALETKFSRMSNPFLRSKMFLNAKTKGDFFIAKGPRGQIVGLTAEDANAALKRIFDDDLHAPVEDASPIDTESEQKSVEPVGGDKTSTSGSGSDKESSSFDESSSDEDEDDPERILNS